MINSPLAELLNEMADLLELKNENVFRIRAFRRAAEVIENYPVDFGAMKREEHLAVDGIGKGIADIVEQYCAKGKVDEHVKLKSAFPEGFLSMLKLQGLGPKRAVFLYENLKIDSLPKLAAAAKAGKLQELKGFGPKLEQNLLKSLSFLEQSPTKRQLLFHARRHAKSLKDLLKSSPAIKNLEIAGSLRRWKETVGDFDFICTSAKPEHAIDAFLKFSKPVRVLASGKTKASVVLSSGTQADFRVVEEESFGAALLYFTGSKEHNVRLRELAQDHGWTLNEYGLFRQSDKKQTKPLAGRTEEEVYRKLGLDWIAPELREDRGEITAAREKKLPKLVEEKDINGDFHNHTTESDGRNSLEEMVEAAQKQGWSWYYCGDHSPSTTIANGLNVDRLRKKQEKVKKLAAELKGFSLFCSSEVDILADGRMDYPDDVLASLDCVVASVHSRFNQPEKEMTDRICRALENRHVDILGHLSGRLINRRDGYAIDLDRIFETARKTQTAIEINGQPERAELRDGHVKRAIEMGIPLVVDTDAHSTGDLEFMKQAIHIARRGWAEPKNILNCLSAKEIQSWLGS